MALLLISDVSFDNQVQVMLYLLSLLCQCLILWKCVAQRGYYYQVSFSKFAMSFITNFHTEIHKHTRIPTQEPPSTMSYNRLKFKNWLRVKIGSLWLSWKVFTGIKKKKYQKKIFFWLWEIFFLSFWFSVYLVNIFWRGRNYF